MIGRNEIILNEATMKEAVTYWLASFMVGMPVIVESVKPTTDLNGTFRVVLYAPSEEVK